MYRVMIIDDERSIRNLLKLTVSWKELGLEVAGEAASGIEAINSIDDIRPDIVFVDIRMPFMNGIEFSKLAIKRYPRLKIIILTAFNEFEYARECIGIGVAEYLLKPIVRNDVNEACRKVIEQLKQMEPEEEAAAMEGCNDITKIQEYIRKNYRDPELNLTSIAQEFGFNSSYLSRRFKADIGINLIDYITKCRMEKAMEYAKMKKLMYITAKEVGIPDPNYFGKCFKKYSGKSYSDILKENTQE